MISSACRSLCSNFWVVFSSSVIRRREGSGFFSFDLAFSVKAPLMFPRSACRCQVIRLEEYNPLPTQKGAHPTLLFAGFRLPENTTLVFCRKPAADRLLGHLGIRNNRQTCQTSGPATSRKFQSPYGLLPFPQVPLKHQPTSIPSSPSYLSFPPSIIYSKLRGGKCLTYIGTEGDT